jgi:hypothetical protein
MERLGAAGLPAAIPDAHRLSSDTESAGDQLGADPCRDLGVHELVGHPGHGLGQHVGVLIGQQLVGQLAAVILGLSAIVVSPFVALLEQTDDHETRGGRGPSGPAAFYITLTDSTRSMAHTCNSTTNPPSGERRPAMAIALVGRRPRPAAR